MTGSELARIAEYILDRWPSAAAWKNADRYFEDFSPMRFKPTMAAVVAMFRSGRTHGPSPSEVLADARQMKAFEEEGRQSCVNHVWAILEEHEETGFREAMCSICQQTGSFPPGRLRTPGELEAAK